MNAKSLAPFMLASTTVVIDINGEIRELVPGEVPGPGEVIVVVGQGATAATEPQIEAQLVGDGGENFNLDLDNEIASIIEQIEEGVDPTQNEDFATAAGGQNGSSPTGTGDIERTGAETLAETQFDTSGLESQGLSETQSLTLLDLVAQAVFVGDDAVEVFETDVPLVVTGTVTATETDVPTFVPQDGVVGDNGIFSIDADGNWTYVANSAYDELNIGDSLVDVFPIESTDGTVGSVTVTINGTNDLPQFVATDDFVPGGGEGEEQLSTFAFEDGVYSFDIPENTAADVPIGQVAAEDPDNDVLIFSISTNIQNEGGEDLFQIDPDTGVISLTEAGAESFVNDFEILENVHNIVVTVTEGDGIGEPQSVDVDVIFTELNEDDNAPVFEDTDEGGEYNFEYNENSTDEYVIGTVSATDADGENVTYSIKTNVFNDAEEPLFEIDSVTGEISLTAAGVAAFTNDYELAENEHSIVVTATEDEGLGPVKTTDVTVNLDEVNLDDNAPVFEDTDEGGEYNFEYNENSTDEYVIGTVSATDADGENVTYSIKTNVFNDAEEPLFEIDSVTGEISLTAAGVAAFTNDYELAENEHSIVVTATEDEGFGPVKTTDVTVNLDEVNLDDNAPEFDPNDGDQYSFSYFENNTDDHVIGTVSATDADGEEVTYSIKTNVFNDDDEALFEIHPTNGNISLTAAGVLAFTNNFEALANVHTLVVTATEVDGFGIQKSTDIDVELSELNVNELPVTEDFDVDAGDAIFVPIIFDSDDEALDHISDEDDDFNGVELNVMITSLPQYGTLLYTDDFGETRVLTEADLHVMGEEIDPAKLFDPNNFTYVPGPGDPFEIGYSGDPDDIVLDDDGFYNWGEWVSDTERLITLDNGNTIGISITDNNNMPLKQYTGGQPHVGWGIGDTDGNGMNKQEALIIDFSDNPLDVVTFGLDGMGAEFNTNSSVYVEVTYTFADGTTHVEQYQKGEGDVGNEQILYEFSYSSPDNPIVEMELSSTGGNWELRYLSGTQDITEDVTFDYVAVDSDLAISNESTVTIDVSESPEYEVLSAAEGDDLDAELGNQVMLGDENDNVFTWLDSTLDNGTDVVDNFDLGSDLIDLRGILEEDDNVLVGDLIDSISAEVDGDDVVMTVTDDGREQTIILEGVTNAFEDAGLVENNSITNELEMLTQVLKTDAA